MEVVTLDEAGKMQLLELWKPVLSLSKANTLEANLGSCHEWFKVVDEENIRAIFEIRRVPLNGARYIKSMLLDFAPDLDINPEGQSFKEASETLKYAIEVLGYIFSHLLSNDTKCFKIHNEHSMVRMFFFSFAEYLAKRYPEEYDVAFYGNWLEITAKK